MQTSLRIIGAIALLAVASFCSFGFMASYEYTEAFRRLPWQLGYGLVGIACLFGIVAIFRPRNP